MPVPFKVTENMLEETRTALTEKVEKFLEELKNKNLINGTIKFEQPYEYPTESCIRPEIEFSPEAWMKMTALIATNKGELAWYGVVDRKDEAHFYVSDILVYPQVVTGATVDHDEGERSKWFAEMPREIRSKCRLQAHSHVDFSPTPSGEDMNSRKDFLKYLSGNEYMIYMIINKKYEFTVAIYDLETNAIYKNNEVDIVVKAGEVNLFDWYKKENADKIKTYLHTPSGSAKTKEKGLTPVNGGKTKNEKEKSSKKELTKSQLQISASAIVNHCMVGYYEADAILDELLEEVNSGHLANNPDLLLIEADAIRDKHDALADYGYGYSYGYGYGGHSYGY